MNDLVKRSDVIAILKENGWLDDTSIEELIHEVPTAFHLENVEKEIEENVPLYVYKVKNILRKGGVDNISKTNTINILKER